MGIATRATATAPSDTQSDHIETIADEITTLAAHLHAATHRLLELLAEFDRLRGWESGGWRSCAHWLAFHTGIELGAAREKVRAARALERLPLTAAAMRRGELSFAKVRSLTRVATPETEAELLGFARTNTAAQLEVLVREWRYANARSAGERERVRHATRRLSIVPDDDGMYVIRGRLDPEVAAVLMRALDAAGDALYRESGDSEAAQRRADAIGLLAERALEAGFAGAGDVPAPAAPGVRREVPVSGTRAARYQVMVHVDAAALRADSSDGRAGLDDGTQLSAETSRRIACDAAVVNIVHAGDGSVLDVGRRTRTVPPALRRALDVRDRGCRFPGCGMRFTDAHHVVHWADGGETKLRNTILLCRVHHRLVHEDGYRVELHAWPGGRPTFYDRRGLPVPDSPPVKRLGDGAVAMLKATNCARGAAPDARTCVARYRSVRDVPAVLYDAALVAATG